MRVLAIVPPSPIESVDVRPPIQLAYIASILQQEDFEVDILDAYALQISQEMALKEIEKKDPDTVILNLYTSFLQQRYPALVDDIKKNNDCILIGNLPLQEVCGQTVAETFIEKTDIDIIVRGEPELTISEIASRLEKNQDLKSIKGISFKENDNIFHNSEESLIQDLDKLPFPARSLLPNQKYQGLFIKNKPFTYMFGSRGCPYKCIFCDIPLQQGRRYRWRSANNIADELEWTIEKEGIKEVHFEDSNFIFNKKRCKDICEEIISRRIDLPWSCHSRVDSVNKEVLQSLKDAGCYQIHFGVESGDPSILQNIRKGINITQIKEAFKTAKTCGLETHAFFMIGNLGESEESIKLTKKLCKELEPDFASFPVTIPVYGTEFNEIYNLKGENIFKISTEKIFVESWRAYNDFYKSKDFMKKTLQKIIKQPSRLKSLIELYMGYKRLQKSKKKTLENS
jgi:radical SAM superfamily enzyme YgiQ (UPF0313 family)